VLQGSGIYPEEDTVVIIDGADSPSRVLSTKAEGARLRNPQSGDKCGDSQVEDEYTVGHEVVLVSETGLDVDGVKALCDGQGRL
jgi:hypothetical protein